MTDKRKLKILHTVQGYYPFIGGSEQLVRRLSERLVQRGHDVTVFTSSNSQRDFTDLHGVSIKSFPLKGNGVRGIEGNSDDYINSVVHGKFNIMMNYAAQTWTTDLLLPILRKVLIPKIIAPCGYSGLYKRTYKSYFEKMPQYLLDYNRIIYHSPCYQDKIFGDVHMINHYTIIPNFADETEFLSPHNNAGFREKYAIKEKYIFLTVANHFREKGHSFVIDAFLKANIDDSVLLIVGNETNKINLISDCYIECKFREKLAHGKIKLLTHLPRTDVVDAYKAANIFLFGSHIECSPLVIFEAMASKTPWISTNVGNISELKGGILIESAMEMANAIKQLIDSKEVYENLMNEGFHEWINNYQLSHITSKYEELYMSVVS